MKHEWGVASRPDVCRCDFVHVCVCQLECGDHIVNPVFVVKDLYFLTIAEIDLPLQFITQYHIDLYVIGLKSQLHETRYDQKSFGVVMLKFSPHIWSG